MSSYFAGLDWASTTHAVCIIDEHGSVRRDFEVAHTAAGLGELVRDLKRFGAPPIAIERPSGLLVDTLVEAGFTVVPIHPNVVKATRPRYRSHGAKSDASDAYLLADLLRTDGHRFRPLAPQSDELRALLESFWPGAAEIFADLASSIAVAFIERYPTPDAAARLGPKRLAAFCAQHAYCGRRPIQELLARLQRAPTSACAQLEMEAKGELARALARTLRGLLEQQRALSSRIEHHVAELEDGRLLMSFPRAGRICAAQLLAEIGSVRERFVSEEHLAAEAGVAPITFASGKSKAVVFRFCCNHRLRAALTCLADNSRHASPWAAAIYARARARGCDHPHAARILARAWIRVIWRAWQDRKPYDPTRHRAAQHLIAVTSG